MADADAVLTDWLLAIECAVFAWRCGSASALARWSRRLFVATAVATLAAGTVHGFATGARILWIVTMLAAGVVAFAACGAGATLVVSPSVARMIVATAGLDLGVYAVAVVGGADTFRLPLVNCLAACAVLLAGLTDALVRRGERAALAGIAGVGWTVVGARMQQAHVGLPALSLDHNVLFHVVQGVALAFLFIGFRRLERRTRCSPDATS
jgi:hypothetical protein